MGDEKTCSCCGGSKIFAVIILILGIIWLLGDLNVITLSIPWLPIIVIVISLGMMFCSKK